LKYPSPTTVSRGLESHDYELWKFLTALRRGPSSWVVPPIRPDHAPRLQAPNNNREETSICTERKINHGKRPPAPVLFPGDLRAPITLAARPPQFRPPVFPASFANQHNPQSGKVPPSGLILGEVFFLPRGLVRHRECWFGDKREPPIPYVFLTTKGEPNRFGPPLACPLPLATFPQKTQICHGHNTVGHLPSWRSQFLCVGSCPDPPAGTANSAYPPNYGSTKRFPLVRGPSQ